MYSHFQRKDNMSVNHIASEVTNANQARGGILLDFYEEAKKRALAVPLSIAILKSIS
jgi:hypothetical protein